MNKGETKRIIGEVSGTLLKGLLIAGAIVVAGSSPRMARGIWKYVEYEFRKSKYKKLRKLKEEQWKNSFYYLRGNGLIDVEYRGRQLYIHLTEEGKKVAKKCRIDDLKIKKPKKWDKKWRMLIFDIGERDRAKREALRGKIKELGLFKLQKSIWIHPYDFSAEIAELKKFFLFREGELVLITAEKIENDGMLKNHFKLV